MLSWPTVNAAPVIVDLVIHILNVLSSSLRGRASTVQSQTGNFVDISFFLRASAMLKHVLAIGWMSIRPSVTHLYCIKTAEYIVMLSSPHDSPFILVLCVSRSSQNSDGVTLLRGR